jgi:hypothetical protein
MRTTAVIVTTLALMASSETDATAGTVAARASAKARHRYELVTGRHADHWKTRCRKLPTRPWRCRSQVWNDTDAVRGFYIIRVSSAAKILSELYVF